MAKPAERLNYPKQGSLSDFPPSVRGSAHNALRHAARRGGGELPERIAVYIELPPGFVPYDVVADKRNLFLLIELLIALKKFPDNGFYYDVDSRH